MSNYKFLNIGLLILALLNLLISTVSVAATSLHSKSPVYISRTPISPLTPETVNLNNGLKIYGTLPIDNTPLVSLEGNGTSFDIQHFGIQLGTVITHSNGIDIPMNATLYVKGDNTTLISSTQTDIVITGSGDPASVEELCTYANGDCSVLRIGSGDSIGSPDASIGTINLSLALSNAISPCGKLFIQGSLYATTLNVGTSEKSPGKDDSSGFGDLELSGKNSMSNAYLSVKTIYLPGLTYPSSEDHSGYGVISIGPYATVNANNLFLDDEFNSSLTQEKMDQVNIQGPNATVQVLGSVVVGLNTPNPLPIHFDILNGGVLNIQNGLTIQGPTQLSNPTQNPITMMIASTSSLEKAQVNLTGGNLTLEDNNSVNIGNPKGAINAPGAALLNVKTGSPNGVAPVQPNVLIEGHTNLNIYSSGSMDVNFDGYGTSNLISNVLIKDDAKISLSNGGQFNIGSSSHPKALVTFDSDSAHLSIGNDSRSQINGTLALTGNNSLQNYVNYVDIAPGGMLTVRNIDFGYKSKINLHYSSTTTPHSGILRYMTFTNKYSDGRVDCVSNNNTIYEPTTSFQAPYITVTCSAPSSPAVTNKKINIQRLDQAL